MAPLVVDPEALFAAGSAVVAAGDGMAANLTVLTAGFAANIGRDVAGTVFGLAYQDAAESLLKAAAAAINACRQNGALIQVSASNYSKAEAASTLGGGAGVLQAPGEPVKIAAPGPPGTLGPGQPPPLLWAVVESFVDDVWPDGDVAGLHAAAARWRSFGAAVSAMRGALNASKSLVGAQQIAEGEQIDQVLSQIGTHIASIGEQCGKLATALDDFADEVDHAQGAIRDLLQRLGSLADLGHDVVLIFEGDAIDEIKKIAEDIEAVLHNLGREARAFEHGMKLLMQVVDDLVVEMEKYMRRQFTHFLGEAVGNQVATTFDFFINANEGVLKGAVGMVQAMVDLDPRWFLIDPKGAAATWMGMTKTGLINHFLNPQEAGEADIQMLKSLLHLEDWRGDRPGLGFGENVFDVATLFLPGIGEAGVGAEAGGAAARGAEAAADAAGTAERAGELGELAGAGDALGDVSKTGSDLTKDLQNLSGDPLSGRPVDLPPGKLPAVPVEPTPRLAESVPPDTPPPESPTAPPGSMLQEAPGAPVGPHDAAPASGPDDPVSAPAGGPDDPVSAPAGGPHEPVPVPAGSPLTSVPAAAGDRVPSTIPQLVEHSPPRAPVSPSGSPVEPAPIAAHSPQPAPSLTSAAPHYTPPSGHPSELPAPGPGGWHWRGAGGPPSGRPHGRPSHGGRPHGPADGGPPGGHRHGSPHGRGGEGADHENAADGGNHPTAIDRLTSDDRSAIAHYTGSGYQELNNALRSRAVDASQQARIEALNSALEKLPAYDGPVVRGTNLPPEALARYQPDEVITEDAFLSTSTNPAVARSPSFAGNVEFRILSSTGRDISSVSMFPTEQEVLFPAGTKFYVLSKTIDPVTGKTIIEMIER